MEDYPIGDLSRMVQELEAGACLAERISGKHMFYWLDSKQLWECIACELTMTEDEGRRIIERRAKTD